MLTIAVIFALLPFPFWDTGDAQAPMSKIIVVSAFPAFQLPPIDFQANKVSNSEALLTWTNAPGATGIEIRSGINQYPATVLDGQLVFSGSASAFADINVDLSGENGVYYRAWHTYAGPVFSTGHAEDSIEGENFMAFIGLVLIPLVMTIGGYYVKRPTAIIAGSIGWIIVGIYALGQSDYTWDYWYTLFFFGMFMGFVTLLEGSFMRTRGKTYVDQDGFDDGVEETSGERVGGRKMPWKSKPKKQPAAATSEARTTEKAKGTDHTSDIIRQNAIRAAKARANKKQSRVDL